MLSALRLAVAACLAGSVSCLHGCAGGLAGALAPAPTAAPSSCVLRLAVGLLPPRALGHRPGEQGMHTRGRAWLWCEQSHVHVRVCVCACVRVV